jgi:hypothetical protein
MGWCARPLSLSPTRRRKTSRRRADSASLTELRTRWRSRRFAGTDIGRANQVVFQTLAHTLGTPAAVWRMLSKSHAQRNRQEYEGVGEIDEWLLHDLSEAGDGLLNAVRKLAPPPK